MVSEKITVNRYWKKEKNFQGIFLYAFGRIFEFFIIISDFFRIFLNSYTYMYVIKEFE